jgi:hypothetical protein
MKITNILIFVEGGHRLFRRDYDMELYQVFDVDHILNFMACIQALLNTAIALQPCKAILFEDRVIFLLQCGKIPIVTDNLRYSVMIMSLLEKTVTFSYQKSLLETLAKTIGNAFQRCMERSLIGGKSICNIQTTAFEDFCKECDMIVEAAQSQNAVEEKLMQISFDSESKVPKERRVVSVIEEFEAKFGVPNTAVFNEDALLIAIGFQKNYIDADILGGNAVRLFDMAASVVDEILAKPHHIEHLQPYLKHDLPKRPVELKNIIVETVIENLNRETNQYEKQYRSILISNIAGVGYIAMLIESKGNLEAVEQNLPDLKAKIRTIFFS